MDSTSIKKTLLSMILILTLAVTVGCGGSASSNHQHNNSPLDPQGNWSFVFSSMNNAGIPPFGGQLYELNPPTVTSNQMGAFTNACGNFTVSVAGSVSDTDSISLTVTQVNPTFGHTAGIYSLTGTIAQGEQSMSGTWTTTNTGGCFTDTNGTWTASVIAPLSGTYSGTSNTGVGISTTVTENTDQTSATMGYLTGSISLTNTSCLFPDSLNLVVPSVHVSNDVLLTSEPDANGVSVSMTGHGDSNGFSGPFTFHGGICDGQMVPAVLNRN